MDVLIQPELFFCYNRRIASVQAVPMKGKREGPNESGALEFAELYRVFQPKILRYLRGMIGETEAEDVVQDVFLKVSRGLKKFKAQSRVSPWIYRIATNAAIDHLRRPSSKQRKREGTAIGSPPGKIEIEAKDADACANEKASTAETSVIHDEMYHCLRNFVDKLPANQRAVVVLSFLEGMKNAEVAKVLGINIQTVKMRLHRGRTGLIKDLEAHCGWFRDARNHLTWDGKIL